MLFNGIIPSGGAFITMHVLTFINTACIFEGILCQNYSKNGQNLIYTMFQKTVKIVFVITSSNFHQLWIFFGKEMGKRIEFCKVHSFSTLPNLCQRTTMWNTDAPNSFNQSALYCEWKISASCIFIVLAIFVPNIIKIGENLT